MFTANVLECIMTSFGLECLAIAPKRLTNYLCHVRGKLSSNSSLGWALEILGILTDFIFIDWVPPQSCSGKIYPYTKTFCIMTLFSLWQAFFKMSKPIAGKVGSNLADWQNFF